jgi:hypothetical protein
MKVRPHVLNGLEYDAMVRAGELGTCRYCGSEVILNRTEHGGTLNHGDPFCEMFVPTCRVAGSFQRAAEVVFIPAIRVNAFGGES